MDTEKYNRYRKVYWLQKNILVAEKYTWYRKVYWLQKSMLDTEKSILVAEKYTIDTENYTGCRNLASGIIIKEPKESD